MRSNIVVVCTPSLQFFAGIVKAHEGAVRLMRTSLFFLRKAGRSVGVKLPPLDQRSGSIVLVILSAVEMSSGIDRKTINQADSEKRSFLGMVNNYGIGSPFHLK